MYIFDKDLSIRLCGIIDSFVCVCGIFIGIYGDVGIVYMSVFD